MKLEKLRSAILSREVKGGLESVMRLEERVGRELCIEIELLR